MENPIVPLLLADAGVYHVEVVNIALPALTLVSYDLTLQILMESTIDVDDLAFKKCLKESHPQIFDGNDRIIIAEAKKIIHINCSNKGIVSLKGLEIFTGVKEVFVDFNDLEHLPSLETLSELEAITMFF